MILNETTFIVIINIQNPSSLAVERQLDPWTLLVWCVLVSVNENGGSRKICDKCLCGVWHVTLKCAITTDHVGNLWLRRMVVCHLCTTFCKAWTDALSNLVNGVWNPEAKIRHIKKNLRWIVSQTSHTSSYLDLSWKQKHHRPVPEKMTPSSWSYLAIAASAPGSNLPTLNFNRPGFWSLLQQTIVNRILNALHVNQYQYLQCLAHLYIDMWYVYYYCVNLLWVAGGQSNVNVQMKVAAWNYSLKPRIAL